MNNTRIKINNEVHEKSFLIATHTGQGILMRAKDLPDRPQCLCITPMPEMYISRRGGRFYLSRMPGTGNEHADGCQSHISEPFVEAPTEITCGELLDKLWDRVLATAEPKKPWGAMEYAVQNSASDMLVDGAALIERLLVPRTFMASRADELKARYEKYFSKQASDPNRQARYWTFGILKQIVERQYSYQATLKHLPSVTFWVHKDLFGIFPPMPPAEGDTVLCLFSCRKTRSGVEVDEAAAILIDSQWQPKAWGSMLIPPTDDQIAKARAKLGIDASVDRELVFGKLLSLFLSGNK